MLEPVQMAFAAVVGCIVMYYSIWPMLKNLLSGVTKGFIWAKTILPKCISWLENNMPKNKVGRFCVKALIATIAFPVTPTIGAVHTAIENPEKAPGIAALYFIGLLFLALILLRNKRKKQKADFDRAATCNK